MQSEKIAELLHQYFELGVAEGREGRNHDTEAGDAQRVLSEIEAEIAAFSAAEPIGFLIPRGDVAGPDNEYYSFCEDQGSAAAEADIYDKGYFPIYASPPALTAQVQDVAGWQLVPKEPTEEMIAEACSSAPHVIITYTKPDERDGTIPLIPLATWRAMLAAAPAAKAGVQAMTHPPATCELCGDTGLYSPSALPCPKGCKDIVERLVKIAEASRREDGSLIPLGQEIADAVEYITNMQQYISELEQREKDARETALEDAAKVAEIFEISYAQERDKHEVGSSDHYMNNSGSYAAMDIAAAIRALNDEVR